MKQLIIDIIKQNLLYITALLLYSTISGIFWNRIFSYSNPSTLTLYSFLLLFQELTYPAIQNLLTVSIYNNIIKDLKKYTLNQIKSREDIGLTNAKFMKINDIRNFINKIFDTYKNVVSVCGLLCAFYTQSGFKNLAINIIFLLFFAIYFYYAQKKINHKRKIAWSSTEKTLQELQQNIMNIEDIKQSLISNEIVNHLLDKEADSWHQYYFISNTILILNSVIFINELIINPHNLTFCYVYIKKINNLTKNFKIIIQYCTDFAFLQEDFSKKNNDILYSPNLKVQNVKIYNSGPFTFEMKTNLAQIEGKNGAGKTLLAKAIANLVPFQGMISAPKSVYIGLDSQITNEKLSKGQKILKNINLAIEKNYELFILDEVLDLLSKDNFKKILKKIRNKKVIIITHKDLDISPTCEKFIIKNNSILRSESD